MELTAGEGGHLVHVLLDDAGQIGVDLVGGLAALEVDVGVLGGHLGIGSLGTQSALTEPFDVLHVDQGLHVGVVEKFNLLILVGGAEPVEEGQEGHFALEGGQMGHESHVVGFLNGGRGGHGETGGAAGHHVGVIAEDREGLGSQSTGGNMEHGRQHFAGDLVHVGDHQQQALTGRVGDGQSTGAQGAVSRARGAGFGLHFHDPEGFSEHVFHSLAGPGVGVLAHGRGRGDGVEGGDFAERVSDVTGGMIAVDGLHFFTHFILLLRVWKSFLRRVKKQPYPIIYTGVNEFSSPLPARGSFRPDPFWRG